MKIDYPLKRDKHITQHFGERPEVYKQYKIGGVPLKGHEGIDLRAEIGTEVLACSVGFCVEALDQGLKGYGKYIKLVHDWGESVYAHLSEFKIKQGTEVKKGQTIALSGNTGNSTGPHLHFGIRINPYTRGDGWGGYSDPEPYLFGDVSTELDMPDWAKKLQPFFIENNLQNGQIEGAVREWRDSWKIIQGFVTKWVDKFELTEDMADLGHIEVMMETLVDTDLNHIELVGTCEEIVGHFEDEGELRNALRIYGVDKKKVAEQNKELIEENIRLRKRRVLDRHTKKEVILWLISESIKGVRECVQKIKDKFSKVPKK